jgi:hypothetical protein
MLMHKAGLINMARKRGNSDIVKVLLGKSNACVHSSILVKTLWLQ